MTRLIVAIFISGYHNIGFAADSELLIEGLTTPVNYTYDVYKGNTNFRTIKQFSTEAKKLMHDPVDPNDETLGNRPYPTFQKFYDYYEVYSYADNWINAAFNNIPTKFARGNADFTDYDPLGKVGTCILGVFRYMALCLLVTYQFMLCFICTDQAQLYHFECLISVMTFCIPMHILIHQYYQRHEGSTQNSNPFDLALD